MAIQLDGTTGISTSGNIIAAGTIQAGVLNIGTLTSTNISSSGNVTAGASVSATGNIIASGATINGDLVVTGNASLSGNIVADRIVNGTSEIDIQTPGGNANVNIGGVSNVVVFASNGEYVNGLLSVSGNVDAGNIFTGGAISSVGVRKSTGLNSSHT